MAHFIFLILIAAFAIISKAMSASRQAPPPPRQPRPGPPRAQAAPDSEEERMRRFMEAVGLPQGGATPPPIVRQRPQVAQRPLLPVQPAGQPLITPGRLRRAPQPTIKAVPPAAQPQPAPVQPQVVAYAKSDQPQAQPLIPQPAVPKAPLGAPQQEGEALAPAKRPSYTSRSLMRNLRDPNTLREAIILREVLGPPKAFQIQAPITWPR